MKIKLLLLLSITIVILSSGCVTQTETGTGNLVLQITDKQNLNIEKAEVTISNIQVHMASYDNESG